MAEIPRDYVLQPDGSFSHPSRINRCADSVDTGQRTEPSDGRALGKEARKNARGPRSVANELRRRNAGPVVVVTMVYCGSRWIDGDNLGAGMKGLQDAIAASLGVDDSDPRIKWEARQVESVREETIVRIATL